jgi:hypothetical protein
VSFAAPGVGACNAGLAASSRREYWSVCIQPVARDFDFAGSVRHAVKGLAHLGLAARAFASLKLP